MKNKTIILSALFMGLITIEYANACPKGVTYDVFRNYYKEIGDTYDGYRLVREDRVTLYMWRDREEDALFLKKIGRDRCAYSLPHGNPDKHFIAFVLEKERTRR
jgi:hypothetical protein